MLRRYDPYESQETSSFTVASGDQVHVAFTDPLQIPSNAAVPEPGSLALLGIATCVVCLQLLKEAQASVGESPSRIPEV